MATRKPAKKTSRVTAKKTAARKATKPAPKKRAPAAPRTLTPYLGVNDAAAAITWYKKAFNAKEESRMPGPGNKVMHAELRIGDSLLYLSDIFPQSDMVDPSRTGPTANMHVTSRNIDKLWKNAVENGAKVTMPLADQFWGDRYGRIIDPFGHSWAFSWRSKLSKKELEALRVKAMAEMGAPPA